ncbi:hypothetical protein [Fulvivirga imtechensis]|uniref:hypothetical protein n=1 Tax=Fulvivirga imtechensis TaxID=881893 RepID=UPI0012F877C0|nr:hypothetical protein [Fulvivirga imtechensis]
MNKFLKISFLVIMLAIPLSIFIFLKIFGENKFDIPIQHADGVDEKFGACEYETGQFLVPDSLLSKGGPSLIFIYNAQGMNANTLSNQYERIRHLFKEDMPSMRVFTADSIEVDTVQITRVSPHTLKQVMNCGFVTDTYNQYILVDADRRVRGYYNTELDEVDRLIVEIKILLENGNSG